MSSSNSHLLATLRLWTALRGLARSFAAAERDLATPLGLSLVQGQALLALADSGPLTMQEFADRLCIAPSTATRLGDQLESHGWARRAVDPGDRRRNVIELDEPGLQLVDDLVDRGLARTRPLARDLEDPVALADLLDGLARGLRDGRGTGEAGDGATGN